MTDNTQAHIPAPVLQMNSLAGASRVARRDGVVTVRTMRVA